MRIRTQLILAAFVLAVVPLAAIVTYSYHSSRRALENAYRREADRLTAQMDRRLTAIRAELDRRMTFVSALPLPATGGPNAGNIATAMGEAASFVDSLEFQPIAEAQPARREERPDPRPKPGVEARVAAAMAAVDARAQAVIEDGQDPKPDAQGNIPAHPKTIVVNVAPFTPDHPMVIDLPAAPAIPRYVMSEEQQELISEIGELGARLGNLNLPADERDDISREMLAVQKKLDEVVKEDREKYETHVAQSRAAMREFRDRARQQQRERVAAQQERGLPAPAPPAAAAAPAPVAPAAAVPKATTAAAPVRPRTATDVAKAKQSDRKTSLILGKKYNVPVRKEGEVVGQLTARVSPEEVIQRVLGTTEDGSEVPFAIDREGNVYTRSTEEKAVLDRLGIAQRIRNNLSLKGIGGWIVSTSTDPQSGLRIGVARPVGENLDDLRRTAARNFALGLGLIAFALIGIAPLSNHLTRDVKLVTDGAERIAHGDLMTRLPVKTKNELGQLARAFNRMAEDLSINQQKLLEQERARKEQELQQRLMAVEYERKTTELEDARRFQLSMLPKEVPHHPAYGVAVFIQTATEVGGDYYDFHLTGDVLSVTIGDATGHGAKAGTMVTVVKTLFAAHSGSASPASFLGRAAETIKRMELGRMAMALSLGLFEGKRLTLASAGMPPALVHRAASGSVEEIAHSATPLGTLGTEYSDTSVDLASGDTVLFLTDGFPELMNDAGQQLGYAATIDVFAEAAKAATANDVIAALAAAARRWHGDAPPNDDVTFVVVRLA
jgi:serine phosphatase RsbU (regulator of sigma subunit)